MPEEVCSPSSARVRVTAFSGGTTGHRPGPGNSSPPLAIALALVLAVAVFLTFSPALEYEFVSWDDDVYVTDNPAIRDASAGHIAALFKTFQLGNYHPVTFLSYTLDHRFFGLDPRGFHGTNIVLHVCNSLLVYGFFLALGTGPWAALAGAAFFGVHPGKVEPVSWISARKDLLAAFFLFLALNFYLAYTRSPRAWKYLSSISCSLLAMLSKATVAGLPLLLLLLDYLQERRWSRRVILEKIPFFIVSAVTGAVAVIARASYEDVLLERSFGPLSRFTVGVYRLVLYYVPRQFFPASYRHLTPPYSEAGDILLPWWVPVAAAAVPILFGAAAFAIRRRTRKPLFALLFFLVAVSPALPVVKLGISADRFAYVASVAAGYLAAQSLVAAWRIRALRALPARLFLVGLAGVALVGTARFSRASSGMWRNSRTVWEEAVRRFPSVPDYHNNLGLALARAGSMERALATYSGALALDPWHQATLVNRSAAYLETGSIALALVDLDHILAMDPGNVSALNNRALAYWNMARYQEALADLDRVIEIDPGYTRARLNRGLLAGGLGYHEKAIADLSAALSVLPAHPQARKRRADSSSALGRLNESLADYNWLLERGLLLPEALRGRSEVYRKMGRPDLAEQDLRRAGSVPSPGARGAP